MRFVTQLVTEGRIRPLRVAKGTRDVLIVGAGEGGRLVVRELMRNPDGSPNTAHTTNLVHFIYVAADAASGRRRKRCLSVIN